jgi:hypothetical protein
MSVSESAPWLANQPHSAGWSTHGSHMAMGVQEGQFTDGPVGTSSAMSGAGSVGFSSDGHDSTALSDSAHDTMVTTEYWLLGTDAEPLGTGASSSTSGFGGGGFDSMNDPADTTYEPRSAVQTDEALSLAFSDEPLLVVHTSSADQIADSFGDATPLISEHYLMSSLNDDFMILVEAGGSPEDVAMLDSLKSDFFVLTPSYEDA